MIFLPGQPGQTCSGLTRREFLQVGGISIFGLSLGDLLQCQASAAPSDNRGPGWGRAKSVIFIFLQGGPSHIDIWDPKPEAPSDIRGQFSTIKTKVPGIYLSEVMPKLAQQMDKATLVRSFSYTPAGLLNHTAAMYQIMTGFTPDRVSPSGQLEPPAPNDFPHMGSQIAKLKPLQDPMLPFVVLPHPVQESNIVGKGATAGFLGPAYDPYNFFQDPSQAFKIEDLALRAGMTKERLERRATLLGKVNAAMPEMERAVERHAVNDYYKKAFSLILSGKAREAFDMSKEPEDLRDRYGKHSFGQSCLLARRLVESGVRFVQVNWPSVANGSPEATSFDTHYSNFGPLKDLHCPKLDSGLSTLLEDLDQRGLLKETLVIAMGEFGRSPRLGANTSGNFNTPDGRDHWPYCYTGLMAGAGIARGALYGKSDATGSSPAENLVHPSQVLATVYHALGIDPHTIVYNHLNQPRELVQADPVLGLFA